MDDLVFFDIFFIDWLVIFIELLNIFWGLFVFEYRNLIDVLWVIGVFGVIVINGVIKRYKNEVLNMF